MNTPSIIVLCLGVVTLFVGLHHLTFFLRTRTHKENLCFTGMCFSIFLYDLFCVGLYNSTNIHIGMVNQKWQAISMALLGIFAVRFTSTFTERKMWRLDYVFITYWILQITALLFDNKGLTWTNNPDIKHVSFFNIANITYYEVKPGILMVAMSVVGIVASVYIIGSFLRYYIKGHQRRTFPILIGIAFLVFGVLHDSAISAGLYQGFYNLEYMYMALVLAMSYSIADTHLATLTYLQDSEAKYRGVVDNVPDIIFTLDEKGKLTSINERGSEIIGLSTSEIIGKPLEDFVLPEDRQAVIQRREKSRDLKQKRPPRVKFRMTTRDEKTHWISLNTSISYDLQDNFLQEQGVARDITNITTAREELGKLGAAVECAEESIIITDLEGHIVYVNPRFERMTGYSRNEIIGKSSGTLSANSHDEAFYKDLWQTIRSGNTWSGHFTNRKKDGTLFDEEATISPIFGPKGEIINYVAVKRDVTQQMALEGQLRHSQKMEAIGQLAGKIAHDFTNALVIILGNAQLATTKLPKDSELIPFLADITKAANKVSEMTGELLAFAHRSKVSVKTKDVNKVMQGVIDILNVSLDQSITLTLKTAKEPLKVKVDPSQMEEIFVHLAVNAGDAIERNGNITIELSHETFVGTELRQIEDVFNVDSTVPMEFAVITVSDNGSGMPENVRSHVFDPFFTTKESQSTGLGLSTVHGIIKQHDGYIIVNSEPGTGTTFKIFLPLEETEEHHSENEDIILKTVGRNKSVLIVDKDQNASALAAGMFNRMRYNVTETCDAKSAILFLEQSMKPTNIILVDITSSETNGRKLINYCSKMAAPPVIILTSAHGRYHLELTGVIEESDRFISKPFAFSTLTHILSPLHSKWATDITPSRLSNRRAYPETHTV